MAKDETNNVLNLENFVAQNTNTKSELKNLIHYVVREVNRKKLNYHQLKYVFKEVRKKCEVKVPSEAKKLIELPTRAEISSFFAVIENPVHKLIFETLENTGLRIDELCNLAVSQIDFQNNTIMVKEGKGGKDRVTIIGNTLKEKLLIYLESRNNKYLFESNRHTRFSARRMQQLCEKYKVKAKIDKSLTPHTFRHLWNTKLVEQGIEREFREILAGHAKGSKSQDIYTHLGVGGVKSRVIEILDNTKGDSETGLEL